MLLMRRGADTILHLYALVQQYDVLVIHSMGTYNLGVKIMIPVRLISLSKFPNMCLAIAVRKRFIQGRQSASGTFRTLFNT